nr:prefoldin subunit 3-like [Aedes albopictus]
MIPKTKSDKPVAKPIAVRWPQLKPTDRSFPVHLKEDHIWPVFVKTRVPPTKTVCLWLGANVMLEYPLDEAEELLKQNKHSAEVNLKCLEHDQDFLRDQITTTEVNMARVHNYDVKKRQAKKAAEEK